MESKRKLFGRLFVTGALLPALLFFVCIGVVNVHAQTTAPTPAAAGGAAAAAAAGHGELSLAIALAVGLACLGAGYAVGKVGAKIDQEMTIGGHKPTAWSFPSTCAMATWGAVFIAVTDVESVRGVRLWQFPREHQSASPADTIDRQPG